jgi:DNA-binding NarL/FixJ family response regulator
MTDKPTRVLLVDDHAVVREGYRRLLEVRGIVVAAEAGDGEQACRLFNAQCCDVVIMDISLPGIGGLETMSRMLERDTRAKVLVFSMHEDTVFTSQAFAMGARGYITKSSAPEVLVEAVRVIAAGGHYVGHDVAQKLVIQGLGGRAGPFSTLTERELEVSRLLAAGHPIAGISRMLGINVKTIANYQSSIRQKLGIENSVQLLRVAMDHGLVGGGTASRADGIPDAR